MAGIQRVERLGVVAAILILTACASAGASETTIGDVAPTVEHSTTTTTPATTTTTGATTTTRPDDATPRELLGTWRTQPGDPGVEPICLGLGANNYSHSICGGLSIGGIVSFEGDTVTFTSKMLGCPDGIGVYRWNLEGGALTLVQLDPPDECDIRRDHLNGQIFDR